jgi:hypothetical protein
MNVPFVPGFVLATVGSSEPASGFAPPAILSVSATVSYVLSFQ